MLVSEAKAIQVSVILATYNGESTIGRTLESLLRQDRDDVEIIIVDNRSTDGTAELLSDYALTGPFVLLREEKPGKDRALQRGIARSRGKIIVFTDDDIVADPDWISTFVSASVAYADADLFQGQVRHEWDRQPPSWLVRLAEDGLAYAGTPVDKPAGLIPPSQLKGPNFAVRRQVLERIPMVRPGNEMRIADASITAEANPAAIAANRASHFTGGIHQNEDTDFAYRAVAEGFRLRFVPEARIRHIVRPEQIAVSAILRRDFRIGRAIGDAQVRDAAPGDKISTARTLLTLSKLAYKGVSGTLLFLVGFRYAGMRRLIKVAIGSGRIYQRTLSSRQRA